LKGGRRLALGLLVSLVCLALVFRGLSWPAFVQALARANLWLILLAAVFVVIELVCRAWRWQVLFHPDRHVDLGLLFDAINVGYLASNVLPARLGDLIRPYVLGQLGGPPFTRSLSTVMVERVVDGLTVVLVLLGLMPFLILPLWAVQAAAVTGGLFLGAALVLFAIAHHHHHSHKLLLRLLGRLPLNADAWAGRLITLVRGFAVLGNRAVAGRIVAWSAAIWLGTGVSYYLVLRAVGLDLSFTVAVFCLCAIALSMAVPSSPGQVGLFEGAGVLALMLFTRDYERAVSAVLVMHALSYVLLSGLGLWSLARRSLSCRQILGLARQAGQASDSR